ncbi:GspH/FimT family protein [Kangiella sp.]|uniref:GspH/FimT family pseudopilin n=1 Tax=Kangiella sp. TaxID=1920245 RepID=UPI0019ADC76F|nr:GspH/FimT family protein [Kangiella sp.]MBD3653681.1 type II transport protein [Kangiella sp.]
MMSKQEIKAFTLIELMTTIAIVAIMAAIAVPGMRNLILNNRLVGFSNDIVSSVSAARNEAIGSRQQVGIEPNGGDWSQGWRVFVDANDSGTFDAGEEIVREIEAYPNSMSENASPGTNIVFTSRGIMSNLGGWGTLTLCDDRGAGRSINIAGAGNVTVKKLDIGEC